MKYIVTACIFAASFLYSTQVSALSISPTYSRNMTIGSRGDDVRSLQSFLVQKGFLGANLTTGYFGQLTRSAVREYQRNAGLPATGFFGPLTRAHVDRGTGTMVTTIQSKLEGHAWKLTNTTKDISMTFKDGQVSGKVCNSFSGAFSVNEGQGTLVMNGGVISTLMFCMDEELSSLETKIHALLRTGTRVVINQNGDMITLVSGDVSMSFAKQATGKQSMCTNAGGSWSFDAQGSKCTSYDSTQVTETLCNQLGGQYAACGSACSSGMICAAVCVATCSNIK